MKRLLCHAGLSLMLGAGTLEAQASPLASRAGRLDLIERVILERARTIGPSMRVDLCSIDAFVGPGPDIVPLLEERTRVFLTERRGGDCRATPTPAPASSGWHVVVATDQADTLQVRTHPWLPTAVDTMATVLLTGYQSDLSRSEEYTMVYLAGRWSGAVSVLLFNFEYGVLAPPRRPPSPLAHPLPLFTDPHQS